MEKVYHGTSLGNFKNIYNTGKLIPNEGNGVGSWNPGHVYLGTSYGVALAHGYGASPTMEDVGGEPYVVLEFNINRELLLKDPDNNIECNTWEESSNKNGQVSVFGEFQIPEDTIVHFIGGECWDTTVTTNIKNWEEAYKHHEEALQVPGWDEDE
ncbi:gp532 [Bacillus phage G]|uniref:Gp532 n=1 Tax=Bacillus phage G TaxID=2884420 RepID=G3MAS3_9CAUD|nr:gp532 [Bacillus phage G]AEO93790.1 gp532 [Bacillus phage G]